MVKGTATLRATHAMARLNTRWTNVETTCRTMTTRQAKMTRTVMATRTAMAMRTVMATRAVMGMPLATPTMPHALHTRCKVDPAQTAQCPCSDPHRHATARKRRPTR